MSIVSAGIASGAKRQAKKATTLEPRTEAIDHLHKAMSYLGMGQNVAPSTLASIRSAKDRADLVFNDKVRSDLDRAIQTANHLIKQRV